MRAATTEIAVATPPHLQPQQRGSAHCASQAVDQQSLVLQQTATQNSDNQPTHTENRVRLCAASTRVNLHTRRKRWPPQMEAACWALLKHQRWQSSWQLSCAHKTMQRPSHKMQRLSYETAIVAQGPACAQNNLHGEAVWAAGITPDQHGDSTR